MRHHSCTVVYPQLLFIDLVFAVPVVVQRQIPTAIFFCCFPQRAALIADFFGMVTAFLVLRFALCSLLLSTGPRCSIMAGLDQKDSTMQWYVYGCFAGVALCFLRCRQAHDARHHGRYDQRRTVCSHTVGALGVDNVSGMFTAGFAGLYACYAVFAMFVGWYIMPGIMVAGEVAALVIDIGSGTFMAGLDGDDASAAFLSFVAGP